MDDSGGAPMAPKGGGLGGRAPIPKPNSLPNGYYTSIKNHQIIQRILKLLTLKKNTVKNGQRLDSLRKVKSGEWKKVYYDGYSKNKKVSIHYFQHTKSQK